MAGMSGPGGWSGAGQTNANFLGAVGNTAFTPGNMTSSTVNNPWSPYFGEPQKEFKLNPYSAYGRENWALPDAYQGSVPYMTQLFIHVIQNEDLWPTKVVLPIRITENEMEIAWDEIIFDDHMLQPVPEEGISRLVTQHSNERRDHYVRYGIALILEHGFMKTAKGQKAYSMNIMQIRNATLETMYFGVIEALLRSKQYSQAWTRKYSTMARSGAALRGYLGDEVERYMIVQKTEHGFDMLDNKAKKYLRSCNVTPDTWIMPEGTATYLAMVRPENNQYFMKGPEGPAVYNSALNAAPHTAVKTMTRNNCTVYESKSFELNGAPGPVDPLTRISAVGEMMTMMDTISDVVAPSDYKSFMRDIYGYNEGKDDFSKLTLKQALKACCRFDSEGELYFPPDFKMNADHMQMDPFCTAGHPCYVFGDLEKRSLADETIWKLAESVVSKFKAAMANPANPPNFEEVEKGPLPLPPPAAPAPTGDAAADAAAAAAARAAQLVTHAIPVATGAELKDKFYNYLKKLFPTSRLMDPLYAPQWHTGGPSAETAFYFNAMSNVVPDRAAVTNGYSANNWFDAVNNEIGAGATARDYTYLAVGLRAAARTDAAADEQIAAGRRLDFLPKNTLMPSDAGNQKIDWALVKNALSELMATGSATISETALNAATIDKFVGTMDKIGNGQTANNQVVLRVIDKLIEVASELKKLAKDATVPWDKRFTFVTHIGLLEIAKTQSDGQTIGRFINRIIAATEDIKNVQVAGPGVAARVLSDTSNDLMTTAVKVKQRLFSGLAAAGVGHVLNAGNNAEMFLAAQAAAAGTTRASIAPAAGRPSYPAVRGLVGAYTLARMNAEFGAAPEEPMMGARFGANIRAAGRAGDYGKVNRAGYDNEGDYKEKETNTMENRYREIKELYEDHKMERAVMLTFMHTPITEQALMNLLNGDIYFPMEFLVFRPRIRHNMATAILLKAGSETGETLVGHADFQMADDVVRKMHYGHFTLYNKSIVKNSDNVYLAENIVACGYVGGNDFSVNTLDSLMTETERRSMFIALVPATVATSDEGNGMHGSAYFNPIDICGKFAVQIPHLMNLDAEIGNSRGDEHYAGASFYSHVWQFGNTSQRLDSEFVYAEINSQNTLCFQGHQITYNPNSKQFDLTTLNTGHFGDRIYPGCGKVRRMASNKFLEPVSYVSSFGATKSLTSIGV